MQDLIKNLNKIKLGGIILIVFLISFFLILNLIDLKKNSNKQIVTVIGFSQEKVFKNAQFSLDYTIYGVSEEEIKNKLDNKIIEIKSLINNFDKIVASEIEKNLSMECVINSKYYYKKDGEENKCLSNNWKGQARIKFFVKGDFYSDEVRKNILNLAPKIVNSVSGPNFFRKDLDKDLENQLIEKAMKNAKQKAEKIAGESNKKLGQVLRVDEDPIIKNDLISTQSDIQEILMQEEIIDKRILVDFELK